MPTTKRKPLGASSHQFPFLLHQSAELPKSTPFRLTKICSCRMIWAGKRGRLAPNVGRYHTGSEARFASQFCTSDHLRIHLVHKFQNFPGGACPQTPLHCALRALPSTTSNSVPPPFLHSWIRPWCVFHRTWCVYCYCGHM